MPIATSVGGSRNAERESASDSLNGADYSLDRIRNHWLDHAYGACCKVVWTRYPSHIRLFCHYLSTPERAKLLGIASGALALAATNPVAAATAGLGFIGTAANATSQ